MREQAINLYILIITEPLQALAHVQKVKEELTARGQWEQFKSLIKDDEFRRSIQAEAKLRMEAND